ncbi:ATP-dependent helicase, partial [Streptomyces sp. SID8455]|nr:ATP-dependent helicase [Streptomyces sp. SID8455]
TVLAHLEGLTLHGDERAPAYAPEPHDVPLDDVPLDEAPPDEAPFDEDWDWDALPTERPEGAPDISATAPEPVRDPAPHIPAARHPQEEPAAPLTPDEIRTLASWDRDLDALAGELRRARATVHDVLVPASLSATQLLHLAEDPDAFAKELARPMPRPPQPAARRGTR